MELTTKKIFLISLIIPAVVGGFLFWNKLGKKPETSNHTNNGKDNTEISNTDSPMCNFKVTLDDLNKDGQKEKLFNCKDKIKITLSSESVLSTQQDLETVETFYDLFFYSRNSEKEPYKDIYLPREVFTFPEKDPQFFAIKTENLKFMSWSDIAFGIYKVEDQKVSRVCKKGFDDMHGRWPDVEFFTDYPGFKIYSDFGYMGAYGNRIPWIDFYYWDDDKKSFEIRNEKHKEDFRKLLEWYESTNEECEKVGYEKAENIRELYEENPNRDYYCAPEPPLGYSRENVEAFLEAEDKINELLAK